MRSRFRAQLRHSLFPFAALLLAAACASGGEGGQLGVFTAHSPSLAMVTGEERPTHLDINLGAPGYVVVLFVLPARGASVIYPGDSTTNNFFGAGVHRISTAFSDKSKLIDTTYLVRRPGDTTRTRREPPRSQQQRIVPSEIERAGYLLLIATRDSLDAMKIGQRLSGVTIPLEDEEALNAVAKLVVGTTTRNDPWSGYYRAVTVK